MSIGSMTGTEFAKMILGKAGSAARRVGVAAYRHPHITAAGLIGAGTLGVGTVMAANFAHNTARNIGDSITSDYMTNLIMRAQGGPFGPSASSMGMKSHNANTAGLTLAAHYARNRNKYFGMMGLRYL